MRILFFDLIGSGILNNYYRRTLKTPNEHTFSWQQFLRRKIKNPKWKTSNLIGREHHFDDVIQSSESRVNPKWTNPHNWNSKTTQTRTLYYHNRLLPALSVLHHPMKDESASNFFQQDDDAASRWWRSIFDSHSNFKQGFSNRVRRFDEKEIFFIVMYLSSHKIFSSALQLQLSTSTIST